MSLSEFDLRALRLSRSLIRILCLNSEVNRGRSYGRMTTCFRSIHDLHRLKLTSVKLLHASSAEKCIIYYIIPIKKIYFFI